jgi:hypothetical protein
MDGDEDASLVVIPLDPPVLARVGCEGQWKIHATLGVTADAPIRHAAGMLVVHDPTTARTDLLRVTPQGVALERTLPEWTGTRIRDLAIDEHRIFVGGSTERSAALAFVTRDGDAAWTPLSLPESLAISGKAIDGLFVDAHRNRLVALDDIVFPHAMLRYVLGTPTAVPRLVDEVELPGRTYQEHAAGIVANDRWLAIRSTTVSDVGTGAWLDLLDRETLAPTAVIRRWRDSHVGGVIGFGGIAFVGTKLLIAGGEQGVGVFDTKGLRRRTRPFTWLDETRDVTKRVEWRSMGRRVVDIVPVSGWRAAIVVVETTAGREAEWLAV